MKRQDKPITLRFEKWKLLDDGLLLVLGSPAFQDLHARAKVIRQKIRVVLQKEHRSQP